MQSWVVGDDGAAVEHSCRVHRLFDLTHDPVEVRSVLACSEGGHDASGAVLGLEGTVGIQDEGHHVFGKFFVTIQARLVAEVFDDEEMNVPVLGMAEDDRLWVVVFTKELLQVAAHPGEGLDGNGDVLQQGCLAGLSCAGDLGI